MSSPFGVVVFVKSRHDLLPLPVNVIELGGFTRQLLSYIFPKKNVLQTKSCRICATNRIELKTQRNFFKIFQDIAFPQMS